jgi:hypothetical protein
MGGYSEEDAAAAVYPRMRAGTSQAETLLRSMGGYSEQDAAAAVSPRMRAGTTSSAVARNRTLEQSQSTERQAQSQPTDNLKQKQDQLQRGKENSGSDTYSLKTRVPLNITFSSSFASTRTTLPSSSPLRGEYDAISTATASPSRDYAAAWTPMSGSPLREYHHDSDAYLTAMGSSALERVPLTISPSLRASSDHDAGTHELADKCASASSSQGSSRYFDDESIVISKMTSPTLGTPQRQASDSPTQTQNRLAVPVNSKKSAYNKPAPPLMSPPQAGQSSAFPRSHRLYVPQSSSPQTMSHESQWQQQQQKQQPHPHAYAGSTMMPFTQLSTMMQTRIQPSSQTQTPTQ